MPVGSFGIILLGCTDRSVRQDVLGVIKLLMIQSGIEESLCLATRGVEELETAWEPSDKTAHPWNSRVRERSPILPRSMYRWWREGSA